MIVLPDIPLMTQTASGIYTHNPIAGDVYKRQAKDWGGDHSAGDEVHVKFPDDGNRPPCPSRLMWFRFVAIVVAKHFYIFRGCLSV